MTYQIPPASVVYRPEVFNVQNFTEAMNIVVTPELGTTTEERWHKETPYLVDDIGRSCSLTADTILLDYGCGPGRAARGLIEKFNCHIAGVDFSPSMRLLAMEYVLSERFCVWSPEALDKMLDKGFQADMVIALWVIQHVMEPMQVIERIHRVLRPGGRFYCLNQLSRCLPTNMGWVSDGFDVAETLRGMFIEEDFRAIPVEISSQRLFETARIQVLRKKG